MQAGTEGVEKNVGARRGSRGRNVEGRKDQGTEAVINLESLQTKVDHLVDLKKQADQAAEDYNDAVKKVAEESGLLAATVSKFVKARAGDRYDETKKKALQLAFVFEEIDINSK